MVLNDSRMLSRQHVYLFIVIPVVLNILLMGFYFSGVDALQQIISVNNGFLTRESGLLEQLENIYLLTVFVMFAYFSIKRINAIEKLFFFSSSLIFLFLLLEEIDYGINLYEFFTHNTISGSARNWHNESANGTKQNVHYFKQLIDLANFLWFIVLPLIAAKIKTPIIKCLIPHRFFILGFLLTILYSRIAHSLDDLELSVIDGVYGSLRGNISEFREHNTYYLYLLYAFQVINTKLTLTLK
ncbi:MAG: hypothetical protein GQ547_01120 [Methylophaga sp.]|nr:hypothetical protein [Methylophaga sp.]